MSGKNSKWENWESGKSDSDLDDSEANNSESNDSEDDTSASEQEDGNHDQHKTFVDYIEMIVEEEWSGDMEKDMELLKQDFQKYILGNGITQTKFFKQIQKQFNATITTLNNQYEDDGISKSQDDIEEKALEETFNHFIERMEDVIEEIYRRNGISSEEQAEEEDNGTKNEIDESGQLGAGIGKRRCQKQFVKCQTPYNVRKVIRPLTQLELYKSRLANGNQD